MTLRVTAFGNTEVSRLDLTVDGLAPDAGEVCRGSDNYFAVCFVDDRELVLKPTPNAIRIELNQRAMDDVAVRRCGIFNRLCGQVVEANIPRASAPIRFGE